MVDQFTFPKSVPLSNKALSIMTPTELPEKESIAISAQTFVNNHVDLAVSAKTCSEPEL